MSPGLWCDRWLDMREVVFQVTSERSGHWQARSDQHRLSICAASLEELQHEARDALMEHFGPSHVAYRVRLRRPRPPQRQFASVCAGADHNPKRC